MSSLLVGLQHILVPLKDGCRQNLAVLGCKSEFADHLKTAKLKTSFGSADTPVKEVAWYTTHSRWHTALPPRTSPLLPPCFFSFTSLLPPSLAFMPPPPLLRLFLYHYLFRSLYLSAPSLAAILRTPLRLFLLSSVAFFFFYISVCLPCFISSGCWFITGTVVHICVFVHIGGVCTI